MTEERLDTVRRASRAVTKGAMSLPDAVKHFRLTDQERKFVEDYTEKYRDGYVHGMIMTAKIASRLRQHPDETCEETATATGYDVNDVLYIKARIDGFEEEVG